MLSIEPGCGYLFSVRWSVTRPLVFAVGTGDGQLLIYDLKVYVNYIQCSKSNSFTYTVRVPFQPHSIDCAFYLNIQVCTNHDVELMCMVHYTYKYLYHVVKVRV